MLDRGVCPKLTLNIRTDSSAAKGFAARRGLGRQSHSFLMVARQGE